MLFNKKANVNQTFPEAIILLCFGVQGGGGSNITLNVSKNIKISCLAPWQVNISLTFVIQMGSNETWIIWLQFNVHDHCHAQIYELINLAFPKVVLQT